ncbi:polysaccharide pyruvyl transferase family protein [Patescibacteria group bacterium]|nr:polysaccharide pyruvyl transferase family protein [Patescibacteria group bacterium]
MEKTAKKIVICGHYGATNIGDSAIGLSIIQGLQKLYDKPKITILGYDAKRIDKFYAEFVGDNIVKGEYLLPLGFRSLFRGIFKGTIWRTLKAIKRCDQFILGGGGLFVDERIFAVFLWGMHAFWAYLLRKQVVMIGQSVGPLNTRIGRFIAKKVFSRAKFIGVRDENSKKVLERIGVKNKIIVSADAVFGLNLDSKNDFGGELERLNKKVEQKGLDGYFILSIRSWGSNPGEVYKKIVQKALLITEKYRLLPVFVPFQLVKENDQEMLNKILVQSNVFGEFEVLKFDNNIFNVLSVIGGSKFTVGMRLHSLIFSIISDVPCIGISYSDKVRDLMSYAGLSKYVISLDENIDTKIPSMVDDIVKNDTEYRMLLQKARLSMKKEWDLMLNETSM